MSEKGTKFYRKMIALALAGAMALSVTGCNAGQKIECSVMYSANLMEGYAKQEIEPVLTEFNDEKEMDFAVRLFQQSMTKGKNSLVSPLSVFIALAMTANGAKGDTLTQMTDVFGFSVDTLNEEFGSYIANLSNGEDKYVDIANAIWFTEAEHFTVNPEFLQMNANYYEAGIYAAPFNEATVEDINYWVKRKTNEMIPKVLDNIDPSAVMYLVNAVCFDAEWKEKYTEAAIRDGVFTAEDGSLHKAQFMYSEESVYLENESATGFMKYYKEGGYAFVAILPQKGLTVEEYVASLDGKQLYDFVTNRSGETVQAAIPKFEYDYDIELSEVLKTMGMPDAFDSRKADFTGLGTSTEGNIFINSVLHKTFISVDENGTKATGVTVVAPGAECEPAEPKVVYLDRPFVYMILDTVTCTPLFIGTVMEVE